MVETVSDMDCMHNQLSEDLLAFQEYTLKEERNRMSSEMHDTVGHTLTKAILQIEAAKALMLVDREAAFYKIEAASEQARQSLDELRMAVRKLKTSNQTKTLKERLERLADSTYHSTDMQVILQYEEMGSLTDYQEKVVFNAVMEAVTNSMKHSDCTMVKISCVRQGLECVVTVHDNGCGCDTMEPGFGLSNIKNHIIEIGGSMMVQSRTGDGFRITLRFPLN